MRYTQFYRALLHQFELGKSITIKAGDEKIKFQVRSVGLQGSGDGRMSIVLELPMPREE